MLAAQRLLIAVNPNHVCFKGVKQQQPVIIHWILFSHGGYKRNKNSHNKDSQYISDDKQVYRASSVVLQHSLSVSFAILVQMTPKSCLCVGIEFTSFQVSWGLFWSIGKPISPTTSLLLPLSVTFPQLCFPAKPDGVAKVSPPWASI